ncbi:uncharacterized protein LOC109839041 [Asparagus officinalis]|uniref:uncharacterized protein LOC109839041 n=1 Tax=Asparagus officinalis TaxID=4686 RepID=UPI00098E2362|nr:uncharacterized protein LOC109839041 [Asparagus officinalis]
MAQETETSMFLKGKEGKFKSGQPKDKGKGKEVRFLGYVISREIITVDPAKVEVVLDWEPLKTITEIRSYLGLAGYYRRFIQDFLKIVMLLSHLTKKGVPFVWGTKFQEAFKTLKAKFTTTPVLIIPNSDKTFVVYTNASLSDLGGVLIQA